MRIDIGDLIRDVEDGDCYFEGVVVSVNPINYKVTAVRWGEDEDDLDDPIIGEVIPLRWWILSKLIDGAWIDVPQGLTINK